MFKFFDSYSIKARIAPIFLAILPLLLSLNLFAPKSKIIEYISGSLILSIALSLFGSQISRYFGKSKEKALWEKWGGPPTRRFLRHSNTEFNKIMRERCHRVLQENLNDVRIPTRNEEEQNPTEADEIYDYCVQYLISQTRDIKKYNLVFKENVNYGFLRNLWGLKPIGIVSTAIGIIASCLFILFKNEIMQPVITICFQILFMILWIFWVKYNKVKIAAEAYAARLLECCENL